MLADEDPAIDIRPADNTDKPRCRGPGLRSLARGPGGAPPHGGHKDGTDDRMSIPRTLVKLS